MSKDAWTKLGALGVIVVLLGAGAVRLNESPENFDGVGFFVTGVLLLGVFVAVQLHDRWHDDEEDDDERE